MTGFHTLLAFSFLVPTQVLLAPILTHFRAPFITFKLQPAGLFLAVSADGKERPVEKGKKKKKEHEGFVVKLRLPKVYNPIVYYL